MPHWLAERLSEVPDAPEDVVLMLAHDEIEVACPLLIQSVVLRDAELIEIIQRQAPGTWLPLEVRRDGETRHFVAKFPSSFE